MDYKIHFEPAEEGGYTVTFPDLPGCITEGDTILDAAKNAQDALDSYLAAAKALNIPISDEGDDGVR